MHGFDVLDPSLVLTGKHFLEASAGTGKTFAIEQLITRHLIEPEGPTIDQILAVTFTRAATSELKARVRQSLLTLLTQINTHLNLPPYLANASEKKLSEAKRKLQLALSEFDRANIFTIHSFCFHSLQEHAFDADFSLEQKEESAFEELKKIVKDYLRTGLKEESISSEQLEKVFKHSFNTIDLLAGKLTSLAAQRLPIEGGAPYHLVIESITKELQRLQAEYKVQGDRLFDDLMNLAPLYSGFCDKQKKVKEEMEKGLKTFAESFVCSKTNLFDLPILDMIPKNRLKRSSEAILHYPGLLDEMQKKLIPLLTSASDELKIIAYLAEEARKHIERVVEKEDLCFFEDLLRRMATQVENPSFANSIRNQYRAVLIDEFQDTDPLQWKIFSTLFLPPSFTGSVYFVGDPKQAIYRFRQADVYTYLEGKNLLGKETQVLYKNFRSEPPLVEALNTLFEAAGEFLLLPKTQGTLSCASVEAALKTTSSWNDGKGSVHFCYAEDESKLFHFIINEISNLHTHSHVPYKECAVLVKDRYQAARFLKECPLPAVSKRSESLLDSPACCVMQELLEAVSDPKDKSRLAAVLGGPLFGYSLQELPEALKNATESFYTYHHFLETEGTLPLFEAIMDEVGEKFIGREGGERLYQDMLQLAELLSDESDDPLSLLERLKQDDGEAEHLRTRATGQDDSIQVMTIHVSKGLEFAVVFPIGLILATPERREIVRSLYKEALILSDEEEELHRQESDAEKMRQLYVAFTRAKTRLYPLVLQKGREGAPINRFLSKMNLSELSGPITSSIYTDEKLILPPPPLQQPLFTPQISSRYFSPIKIHSFSSLAEKIPFEERVVHEKDILPLGKETGIKLHTLFEKLSFEKAFLANTASQLMPTTAPLLKSLQLEPWEDEINEMVFKALNTPLPGPSPFPLSAVNPSQIWKEVEFLYSADGYIKGFIDLFFEYEGCYYFLDWKSNYLDDYTHEGLKKTIGIHQYDLQERLYRAALNRYLRLFTDKQIERSFYIFLRGPGVLSFI